MSINFDNVVCRYPLPGNVPDFLKKKPWFQTRDLYGGMNDYEITKDGVVKPVIDSGLLDFCRELGLEMDAPLRWKRKRLEIYASNISSGRPMPDGSYGYTTFDGQEMCDITYVVNIRNSVVSSIRELHRRTEPALNRQETI